MKQIWSKIKAYTNSDSFLMGSMVLCLIVGFSLISTALLSSKKPVLQNVMVPKVVISPNIDPEFRSYVLTFAMTSTRYSVPANFQENLQKIVIQFGEPKKLRKDFAGYCFLPGVNTISIIDKPIIIIDKPSWDSYGDSSRESMISHELGHCLLQRNHRHLFENSPHGRLPVSIMFPSVLPGEFLSNNRRVLYDELFSASRYHGLLKSLGLGQTRYHSEIGNFKDDDSFRVHIDNILNGDEEEIKRRSTKTVSFKDAEMITVVKPKKKVVQQ